MRLKKIIVITILLMSIIILASCELFWENDNLRINLKQNKLSNYGYAALTYNNRIYYISNEKEISGIYSMKMDGTDVRLEAQNPSITSIQIYNDCLYFLGLLNINSSSGLYAPIESSSNIFGLYRKPLDGDNDEVYLSAFTPVNENITAFYYSNEGNLILKTGTSQGEIYFYGSKEVDFLSKLEFMYPNDVYYDISSNNDNYKFTKDMYVYKYGDILLVLDNQYDEKIGHFRNEGRIIELGTNKIVKLDHNFDYSNIDNSYPIFANDKYIYFIYNSFYENEEKNFCDNIMFLILDKNKLEVIDSFFLKEIGKNEKISQVVEYNEVLYFIVDEWAVRGTTTLPIKKEKLVSMNTSTFECKIVTEMKDGERIIGLTEDSIIYYKNKGIYKINLNNNNIKLESEKKLDVSVNLNSDKYTIDYAGDWMFIYKIYGEFTYASKGEKAAQQLLYKINIKTGEIMENKIPINFDEFNSYNNN